MAKRSEHKTKANNDKHGNIPTDEHNNKWKKRIISKATRQSLKKQANNETKED